MKKDDATDTTKAEEKQICGIIMPISECESKGVTYSAAHWESMRLFLEDAIHEAGYEPKVVWEGTDQSVIHSRIVNNIANYPLMICVICGSNVNVMIELGLRLMTDKPVFVIYDENTPPPFDITVLQMFSISSKPDYKDYQILRNEIKRVLPTMLNPNYKTFSSNFKTITPKGNMGIEKVELTQFMNETKEAIQSIQTKMSTLLSQRERDNMYERMRSRAIISEKMLQKDIEERESLLNSYRPRLADLRIKVESMKEGPRFPKKYLDYLMDELRMIQDELSRKGLDEYPPIKYDIAKVRDTIEMLRQK